MIDRAHCVYTQVNNVVGTLNLLYAIAEHDRSIHLVKLGTMGEYGTPNIDIEEGFIEITHKGRTDVLPYPKRPGSFYHLSKVHDSHNIEFACRIWGLRATDLNQGVVYGQKTEETSLHPDLATQVRLRRRVRHGPQPLLRPGRRSATPSRSTARAARPAACSTSATPSPVSSWRCSTLPMTVNSGSSTSSPSRGRSSRWPSSSRKVHPKAVLEHMDDPRVEKEEHYYRAAHTKLLDLGLVPHLLSEQTVQSLLSMAERYR